MPKKTQKKPNPVRKVQSIVDPRKYDVKKLGKNLFVNELESIPVVGSVIGFFSALKNSRKPDDTLVDKKKRRI